MITTGVIARRLPAGETRGLIARILDRFAEWPNPGTRLWEALASGVARRRSDGWSLICEYPEKEPILLFEDGEEFSGYEFSSPADLKSVLAESPGFEFYMTNKYAEFVLCFNHHDFIICMGDCQKWLSAIEGR